MKMFADAGDIYLCRDPVDFRKTINGLTMLVEQQMALSPFADLESLRLAKKKQLKLWA